MFGRPTVNRSGFFLFFQWILFLVAPCALRTSTGNRRQRSARRATRAGREQFGTTSGASGIGKTTKMKMTTTTGTTSHPKNLFGMGGKTGPAVVEEVTTKEGAGPGPGCLRDRD